MTTGDYGYVRSLEELQQLIDKFNSHDKPLGYDIETGYEGPDKLKGALFPQGKAFTTGFSITDDPSWARYVPLRHDNGPNLDPNIVWPMMKPLLEQKRIIPHHAKFEQKFAKNVGINLGVQADTMLIYYILSEYPSFGLKDLVLDVFNHEMAHIESLFPGYTDAQLKALRFNVLDLTPEVVAYACEDAAWTLALLGKADERAKTERKFMYKLEHEISDLMAEVEAWGTAVDWKGLQAARNYGEKFLVAWTEYTKEQLGEMAGHSVAGMNLNSTQQLFNLLYGDKEEGGLGLSTTRMTKGSEKTPPKMSTAKEALEELAQKYSAVRCLLQLREISNLRNRCKKWLEERKNEVPIKGLDGRVHANYGQVVVPAGRFAANDPAIQQLPKEWFWAMGEDAIAYEVEKDNNVKEALKENILEGDPDKFWHGNFRDFIVPAKGWYYLGFDFSQAELRIMAGMSQEPALLKAFEEEQDIHVLTAAMMFGIPVESVSKEQRAKGKTFNFALVYQMGIKSLAERLGVSMDEATDLYDGYFAQFTSIRKWMDKVMQDGKRLGYVETYFGRKVTIWEYQSPLRGVREKANRIAVNAPVQGTVADYMKIAMVRCRKVLRDKGWWGTHVKMVANLHDALTFEVIESLDPAEVRALLEPQITFAIPKFPKIVADWEVGYNWGSASSWKPGKSPQWVDGKWQMLETPEEDMINEGGPVVPEPEEFYEEDEPVEYVEAAFKAGTLVEVVAPSKTVVVELIGWPTEEGYDKFLDLADSTPGVNELLIRDPDGEEIPYDRTTGLTPDNQAHISLVLGGAKVYYEASSVDTDELANDLTL